MRGFVKYSKLRIDTGLNKLKTEKKSTIMGMSCLIMWKTSVWINGDSRRKGYRAAYKTIDNLYAEYLILIMNNKIFPCIV